jgi:putative intracellular protease/amidase
MTDPASKNADRNAVIRELNAVKMARSKTIERLEQAQEFLKPHSFADRWRDRQHRVKQQLIDQTSKIVRKNTPVIAIATATALLFATRKHIAAFFQQRTRTK